MEISIMIRRGVDYTTGKLKYVLLKDLDCGDLYRDVTVDSEYIKIDKEGNIKLLQGYTWNGTNCFWDFEKDQHAVALHDALYYLMKHQVLDIRYRKMSDNFLRRMLKKDWKCKNIYLRALHHLRIDLMYFAVRLFGGLVIRFGKK